MSVQHSAIPTGVCPAAGRRASKPSGGSLRLFAGTISFMFSIAPWTADLKGRDRAPNIILIVADDLGCHDLGSWGQEKIQTPHLDQLAARGLRFTQFYSGASVCAPARSSLMTGHHTGNTPIRGNFPIEGGVLDHNGHRRLPLPEDAVILPEVLKTAGYVTGMTGKWGLGEPGTTGEPNRQGFDEWFGFLNQRHAHSYYPEYQWLNGERVEIPENQNGRQGAWSHDLHTDFALDFLRRHAGGDRPFFLYLPYQVPHARYEIPSVAPYENEDWPRDARVHAAMITRLDLDIGRMIALLEEKGADENTLIFFTSDNGPAQRWEGIFDSAHPFRGRKRDLYEGGIRVPMIVIGPGVPTGAVSAAPWYFADLLPTLAEFAGATSAVPADVDGVSVVATLQGKEQPELWERPMYWEFHERGFDQAIRIGPWKGVRHGNQPLEIYNLEDDPGETNDLARHHSEKAAQLLEKMQSIRTPSRYWPTPGERAAIRPEG